LRFTASRDGVAENPHGLANHLVIPPVRHGQASRRSGFSPPAPYDYVTGKYIPNSYGSHETAMRTESTAPWIAECNLGGSHLSRIAVIGAGYVGLVTGACLANMDHDVVCLDIDKSRIRSLRAGGVPLHEPGLAQLLAAGREKRSLHFTDSYADAIPGAEFIFIAVNTPAGSEGQADLMSLRACVRELAPLLDHDAIIVNKSTVPIGTGDLVCGMVARHTTASFSVVSNPEFLREGCAVADFRKPDRLVLGAKDERSAQRVAALYGQQTCPVLITDIRTAEMIKYAANAFLATRISFINEIAAICEHLGADVREVARGMGYDHRIGQHFLSAGVGWGGSCFPKDVQALIHMADASGTHPQLLRAVTDINRHQRLAVLQKLRAHLGSLEDRTVTLLGLSFKPDTDDLRNSPALELAHLLHHEGCHVRAFDPVAMPKAREALPYVEFCEDPYLASDQSDAVVLVTEWDCFATLDLLRLQKALRTPVFIDGRNFLSPEEMEEHGFLYDGFGEGHLGSFALSQSNSNETADLAKYARAEVIPTLEPVL
jgi:UDPglucose 6-dehydrogenase